MANMRGFSYCRLKDIGDGVGLEGVEGQTLIFRREQKFQPISVN